MNKQPLLCTPANIVIIATKIVRMLKLHKVPLVRAILVKLYCSVFGSRWLKHIQYGFNFKLGGTRFQLRGLYMDIVTYYREYQQKGAHEPQVTSHIAQVVRQHPAPRIMDVGAHYGWYTIYLANIMGDKGVVFAFEPTESISTILEQNIALNDLHNVRLYKVPLSDRQERVRMVTTKASPLEPRNMRSVAEATAMSNYAGTISAIPFDELNEKEAIHPNIVKIDVHGSWNKVIYGMKRSLQRDVEHLYLELDTDEGELSSRCSDVQHVFSVLYEAGMDVYEIQHFCEKAGGKITKADEKQIVRRSGNKMLYAVKKR